jgi:hypothetical protein
MRTTALVIAADNPLDNAPRWGKEGRGVVRILVDPGPDQIYVARSLRMTEDRWLVPGMEVPVAIDPTDPEEFEVEWDAIPSIEERAAANDPTLADPIGTQRKVVEALKSAGLAGPDLDKLPGGMGQMIARGEEARAEATPDRFKEALERAAQEPAPAGKSRAVVQISTIIASLYSTGIDGSGPSSTQTTGKRRAVLAVNVPGMAPYAVFKRKFHRPRDQGDVAGAGLPALVSSNDPTDIEILWKELPSLKSQIGQRISDGLNAAQAGMREEQEMQRQMTDAVQAAGAAPPGAAPPSPAPPGAAPPAATPAAGAAAGAMLGPKMQKTMEKNAKQALKFVQDPAQRKMLIDQYRAMGISIDEE